MQLVNHGIPEDVIKKMIEVSGKFFNMDYEERAKHMTPDLKSSVRYGTSFSQTKDTVFCWRDFLKLQCHPLPHFLPHWPSSPVDFRLAPLFFHTHTDTQTSGGKHFFNSFRPSIGSLMV